jgi:hypothetical protein
MTSFRRHARDVWEFIWIAFLALLLFIACLAVVMFLQSIRYEGVTALEVATTTALFFGVILLLNRLGWLKD